MEKIKNGEKVIGMQKVAMSCDHQTPLSVLHLELATMRRNV